MADINKEEQYEVRPDVMTVDDIVEMVPRLANHRKLVVRVMKWLRLDEVNRVHGKWCDTPGPEFVKRMVDQDFRIQIEVHGKEVLEHLPEGAFITVSNHPFGALDGILLIYLITQYRPKFKVLVNMMLNRISAMRPNFIAVDALATDDPEKRKVSMLGIRHAIGQLKSGEPLGFFPAGAMSKIDWRGRLQDREWQKSVIEIMARAKVPVIPIFFQGSNSWWFNFLGRVCWPARSMRLPAEVFRKRGKKMTVTFGKPISVEEIAEHNTSIQALGEYLKQRTFELRGK